MNGRHCDVVIVGAGIAGCTAARLFNLMERLLFRLAATNRAVAASLERLVARREPAWRRLA